MADNIDFLDFNRYNEHHILRAPSAYAFYDSATVNARCGRGES